MHKYIKRPLEVEAVKLTLDNIKEVAAWCNGEVGSFGGPMLWIYTPQGWVTANIGDYIVKGVSGEFYPMKAKTFEISYDRL